MSEESNVQTSFKLCECGCGQTIPKYDLRRKWIERRFVHGHSQKGPNHSGWKGGYKKDGNGYLLIKKPMHYYANATGYVRKHRLVYEESRNCCLLYWIIIHHLDGNKENNVWYNLIPLTNAEHTRIESTGRPRTEEHQRKMSLALKGRKVWNKGKIGIYSQDTLRKMREVKLGNKYRQRQ